MKTVDNPRKLTINHRGHCCIRFTVCVQSIKKEKRKFDKPYSSFLPFVLCRDYRTFSATARGKLHDTDCV